MEVLENNKYFILPQPKYINISNCMGIPLSALLTIFVSKHKIKDIALLLSSKFNKHFNTFLNTIPIRDSALNPTLGDNYYFAVITTESNFGSQIERVLNEVLISHISQFNEILHNCCYDLFHDFVESSLPLNEAYYIDISDHSIWILSQSVQGFYSGIQSLIQIIEHALFLFDKFEEFIILPRMRILDFPTWKTRELMFNLNFFTPTMNALSDLISSLAKYKINSVILYRKSGFPYSEDKKKSLRDLCNFHCINLEITADFEKIIRKNVRQAKYSSSSRFLLPDYFSIFKRIMDIDSKQHPTLDGVLVSSSYNESYPLDLILLAIPIIAELLWNPQTPYSLDRLKFLSEATQVNVFENNPITQSMDLFSIYQLSTIENLNNSAIFALLEQARENAFENLHILEVLEWVFHIQELEWALQQMKKSIISTENPKMITIQIKQQLQQFSNEYLYLKSLGSKILEGSNRVEKGECEKFFEISGHSLESLVVSWIPEITKD